MSRELPYFPPKTTKWQWNPKAQTDKKHFLGEKAKNIMTLKKKQYDRPKAQSYPTTLVEALMGDFLSIRAKRWSGSRRDA